MIQSIKITYKINKEILLMEALELTFVYILLQILILRMLMMQIQIIIEVLIHLIGLLMTYLELYLLGFKTLMY